MNNLSVFEVLSWSKIFGKGFKVKLLIILIVGISNIIILWGGIFVEINIKWIELNFSFDGVINLKLSKLLFLDFIFVVKFVVENKLELSVILNFSIKLFVFGWGEVLVCNLFNWSNFVDIIGVVCWDSVMLKLDFFEFKVVSNSKVS